MWFNTVISIKIHNDAAGFAMSRQNVYCLVGYPWSEPAPRWAEASIKFDQQPPHNTYEGDATNAYTRISPTRVKGRTTRQSAVSPKPERGALRGGPS